VPLAKLFAPLAVLVWPKAEALVALAMFSLPTAVAWV